jgi:enoyl-[acyl-carrier protein] reductase I
MFAFQQPRLPLHCGVTSDELGGAGLYLLSDLPTGVYRRGPFVDCGYNVVAIGVRMRWRGSPASPPFGVSNLM